MQSRPDRYGKGPTIVAVPRSSTRVLALGLSWAPDRAGGGLTRYLRDLVGHLPGIGVDVVTVVTGDPGESAQGVVISGSERSSLPVRLLRYWAATQRLGDVDLMDVHFAVYGLLPLAVGRLRHRPAVMHFQGPWADESATSGSKAPEVFAKRALERYVYCRVTRIVVLSDAFARVLLEHYGVAPWKVRVIPPGVDLDRFAPGDRTEARRRLDIDPNELVIVAVRRLVARVGVDVLIEAVGRLRSEGRPVRLLVVGDGIERPHLEAAAGRSLGPAATFLGAVDDETLLRAYQSADVCVVPTVAHEGFGLVVLEALACGTPVVASHIDGLPEALASLQPDLLVPPGDSGALADRLRSAFDATVPLPGPGRCRQHAEGFAWPQIAERNCAVYREAIAGDGGRRPRVVLVTHCGRLSGAELSLVRLLPALGARADVLVVLGEDGPLATRLRELGTAVIVLPLDEDARSLSRGRIRPGGVGIGTAWNLVIYTLRLARLLRRVRPDLVHTHSLKSDLYGAVAGRMVGVPVLWHVHDRIAPDYLPRSAVRLFRSLARRLPTVVLANSKTTLESLRLPPGEGVVIPYAIPQPDLESPPSNERRPLRVGLMGRLSPWKGQDVFLAAFAEAFPSGGEQAVLIGGALFDEERDIEAGLRRQARELGIDDRVEFRGFRSDIDEELRRLGILVHASVIPEPFGQVVVEGMAAGLPVVAARAGGPKEIITHEENGLLVPPGDPLGLAEALKRLAHDPALRERLGAAGRRRAGDFDPFIVAGQVFEAYHLVLDRGGRGAA